MKIVLQNGIKDCGICCLLSVIRYYGGDISKEVLRQITNTDRSGVSAYNLIEGARKIGFEATGMKGDLSKIEKNNLPCLAHLVVNKSYKHFVVIYDIDLDNNKVLVMDPAKGRRSLTVGEFRLMSSMNFIFLKPIKALPIFNKMKIIKKTVLDFIRNKKILIWLVMFLSLCYFLFQILTAFHLKYILEFSINYKLSGVLVFLSIYLIILYFFKEFSNFLRNILLMKILSTLDFNMTFVTFKQILLLPYLYFKNRTTGEVISRLKDLNTIKNFLGQICCFVISDFLGTFIFGFIMFYLNKKLFIFIIFICLFSFGMQILFNKLKMRKLKIVNSYNDRVDSYLIEAITNIETIKGSHLEKRFSDIFKIKYQKFLEKNYSMNLILEWQLFFKNFINNFLMTVIFGVGGYLVIKNKMSLGELFIYQNIFNYFLFSFNNLLNVEGLYHEYRLAIERVEDLFMIRRENFSGGYSYSLYRLTGDIIFKNLNYNVSLKCLFKDINFSIKYKDKVLLVGESGTGKSTLVKMLMKYIEVPFGFISINNIDINHYHLDNLRNNITYVGNSDTLFTDTFYNNIVLNGNVLKENFEKIVKITKVDEIVKDDGLKYRKVIEEDGFNLSTGERQRVILARALIRKSDIYIFDEAFSQIDLNKTEEILNDVLKYLEDKTVIVISHRNNFYKLFNRVLKLENSQIHEVFEL